MSAAKEHHEHDNILIPFSLNDSSWQLRDSVLDAFVPCLQRSALVDCPQRLRVLLIH